jgi:hypothetical protein
MTSEARPDRRPSSDPVFRRIVLIGVIYSAALAIVGGIVGFVVADSHGMLGAVVGAALSLLLLSVTALSMVIANRYVESPFYLQIFFGVVLGGWLLKFVVFVVAVLLLRDQPWLDPIALFVTVVAGLVGGLVIDGVTVARARIGYVSDPRP